MTEQRHGPYRGVIFDFDGTIADTLPICIEAFQATFARYGGPNLDVAGVRALFGPSEEGVLRTALGEQGEEALATYLDEYRRIHHRAPDPFPGIKVLLDTLRGRGVPLAIVTGKGPHSVALSLDYIGLGGYFDPVEAGSPNGSIKAIAMGSAAGRWGIAPGDIVSVGDHITDIQQGRKAGTHPVAVVWAHPEAEAMLAAEYPEELFTSVAEFSTWLLARV